MDTTASVLVHLVGQDTILDIVFPTHPICESGVVTAPRHMYNRAMYCVSYLISFSVSTMAVCVHVFTDNDSVGPPLQCSVADVSGSVSHCDSVGEMLSDSKANTS